MQSLDIVKSFFLEVKDSTKTKRNMYAEFYIHVQWKVFIYVVLV